jgi:hypothetical protein
MAENQVTLRVEATKARGKGEDSDEDPKLPDLSGAPIFSELSDEYRQNLDHVIVERLGPVREGNLGRFEPSVTDEEIFERHGGGKYRVQGRTVAGRPIKGAFATIDLAGEPLFRSKLARRAYANMTGATEDVPAATGGVSMPEIVAMLEQTRSTAEAERERRAEEEERRHKREIDRLAVEAKIRADERALEDERRRKIEDERDERRRKDEDERRRRDKAEADEREERRRRDDEAARQRDREFQQTLLAASKSSAPAADPVASMLAGVKLAMSINASHGGGGGSDAPSDPLASLAQNLPATVEQLGKLFQPTAPNANANDLTIAGPLGEKGKKAVQHLQQQGIDPATALDRAFEMLLAVRGQPAPAAAPTSSSTTPPPPRRGPGGRAVAPVAPAAPPAPNGAAAAAPPAPAAATEQPPTT